MYYTVSDTSIRWTIANVATIPAACTGIMFTSQNWMDESGLDTYNDMIFTLLHMRQWSLVTFGIEIKSNQQLCDYVRSNKHLKHFNSKYTTINTDLVNAFAVHKSVTHITIGTHHKVYVQCMIIEHLVKVLNLQELILSFNNFSDDFNYDMPKRTLRVLKKSKIKRIGFDSNRNFTTNNVEQQIAAVCNDSSMTHLIIRGCMQTNTPSVDFIRKLPQRIKSIDLCNADVTIETLIAVMKSTLTEFKCSCNAVMIANHHECIKTLMTLNTTMLQFNIGPMYPQMRRPIDEILERNRSITQPAIAATIFDIAVALMPTLNEVYCMLNIIDYVDINYYKYVPRLFKVTVLHKIADKIREIRSEK